MTERDDVAQLEAEVRRYKALAEHATDVVFSVQPNRQITWVSPTVLETLGWSPEELIGKPVAELIHPDDRERIRPIVDAIYDGLALDDVRISFDTRIRTKSGGYRWMTKRISRIHTPDGTLESVISSMTAIDDLVAARARAEGQAELLRATLDAALDPLVLLQSVRSESGDIHEFTCLEMNAAACQFLAKPRSEVIGQPKSRVVGVSPAQSMLDAVCARTIETGLPLILDDYEIAPELFLDIRGQRVSGDRLALTWRDISERHAIHATLAESEAQYRQRLESTSDVVLTLHADGSVEWVSPSCRATLRMEPEALIGLPHYTFIHPEDLARLRPQVTAALQGGHDGDMDMDVRWRCGDGKYRWMSASIRSVVNDESGGPVRVARLRDIDLQFRAQLALAESAELLQQIDDNKNTFIATLSHELRNPLATIRMALWSLMNERALTTEAGELVEVMETQTGHLTRLVDDLLDVARLNNNKISLHTQVQDLGEILRGIARGAAYIFAGQGLSFVVDIPEDLMPADVDATRITQAIENLLSNARKFTPPGGRVDMKVSIDRDQAVYRICVHDNGSGIEKSKTERIFEPFEQAPTSTSTRQSGLGLGLTIVQRIMQLHGGEVSVQSDGPGAGAEFTLQIPMAPASLIEERPVRVAAPNATAVQRVLVIEDDEMLRDMMRVVLMRLGFVPTLAPSGEAGLIAAEASPPDAVLCDIGLPGIDGLEVARRLRALPALEHTRLIALSGYTQATDVGDALAAGFDAHLAKPVEPNLLLQVIAGGGNPGGDR